MAALLEKIAHLSLVDILEMLATRCATQFIVELGFPHAVFEGDSKGIIKVLADGYSAFSSFGHLVKDFRDAEKVDLNDKRKLSELVLHWGDDTNNTENEINVIEQMCPPTNLKALTIKYYGGKRFPVWLGDCSFSDMKNTQTYVKACDKCQRFGNVIRQPPEELTPMTTPWPFAQWGLDIMGPFPTAVRQLKFLVVGIDYFTKWVEAEALATITEKNIRSFVWKNIICRYGIPRVLVSDNGKQFNNNAFRDFCSELGIKNHYSSPAHA
ncbi:uncharacterized protein LOC115970413 [Quercus lobata]|uniref:uncharacterized protein LOC115970413 n=1 Tax=Quercus lobata TaxID=97700 RepID=UPI0012445E0F|nr:uncharacterized protein LOC115970413 [Quercus lobata]